MYKSARETRRIRDEGNAGSWEREEGRKKERKISRLHRGFKEEGL